MNKKIMVERDGIKQHALLKYVGYKDLYDFNHNHPTAHICDMNGLRFEYIELGDIVPYRVWHKGLSGVSSMMLVKIARDCFSEECSLIKGWAALMILTERADQLCDAELDYAMMAAQRHINTLIGRNALDVFQVAYDKREFGAIDGNQRTD